MTDRSRADGRRSLSQLGWVIALGLLTLLVFAGSLRVYFSMYPRNRVKVSVIGIPDQTHFISIVAEEDGELENMDWSPGFGGMAMGRMHPRDCTASFRNPGMSDTLETFVYWRWGARYGVVRRELDKTWWVTWFSAPEVPLRGRGLLAGRGSVEFDLAKGNTEPLPLEHIERLGLADIRRADEDD